MLRAWFGGNVPYLQFFRQLWSQPGMGAGARNPCCCPPALAATFFFLPPAGRLILVATPDAISLGIFIAIGLGISWLNHQLRLRLVCDLSR